MRAGLVARPFSLLLLLILAGSVTASEIPDDKRIVPGLYIAVFRAGSAY